jgi:hypothetical protein
VKKMKKSRIIDPACGSGNLLFPWVANRFDYLAVDTEDHSDRFHPGTFLQDNFLTTEKITPEKTDFFLINPPFNNSGKKGVRSFLPERFLDKITKWWGPRVPVVLFAPMGFRLNQRVHSSRWRKFQGKNSMNLTHVMALPLDTFPGVEFHMEILFFNINAKLPFFVDPEVFDGEPIWKKLSKDSKSE